MFFDMDMLYFQGERMMKMASVTEKTGVPQSLWNFQRFHITRDKLLRGAILCAQQLGAALLGFLLANANFAGGVFASAAPFAVALGAACGVRWLGMGVLGAALGCIAFVPWPAGVCSMAMAAAAGLFNLAFRKFGARQDVAAPLCAFACSAASGAVTLLAGPPGGAMAWIFVLCGAVLSGCCAYFLLLCQGLLDTGGRFRVSRRERAALLLCCGMALTCLGGFARGVFRPAEGLAVLFVLAAAWCWREAGGAIAGACAGASITLAGGEPALAAVYALGGLLAGVFANAQFTIDNEQFRERRGSGVHTVPMAGGFALACVFYVALHGAGDRDPAAAVVFALEALSAILIFLCVPTRVWSLLRASLAAPDETLPRAPESEAALRLSRTASALRKVGEYVAEVSQGLEQLQALPDQSLYAYAGEAPYARCPGYDYCHRAESGLRRAAAAQFETLSALMEEVGAQLTCQKAVEAEAAQAACRVLSDHGFPCHAAACVRDTASDNAAVLTAAVRPGTDHSSLEALTRALSRATGIRFAPPETALLEEGTLLTFAQQPLYQLQTGAVQMSSSRSEYCGDYFDCFSDGRGREVLVISDGMGTGGRAAVDSALATEIFSVLTRSGLSFEGSVNVANQALLLKSCEETLATLDIAGVNLYTGEVEFCKAGGAAGCLRRRGRAARVELSALPAGILRDIRPAQHRAVLEDGDILVLVSDGVLCGQEDWLCAEVEPWAGTMQALAEHLATLAVQRRETSEREDDLTVVCAMLENA